MNFDLVMILILKKILQTFFQRNRKTALKLMNDYKWIYLLDEKNKKVSTIVNFNDGINKAEMVANYIVTNPLTAIRRK